MFVLCDLLNVRNLLSVLASPITLTCSVIMTTNWLKLWLLDKSLTREEYEDIPQPRFELHTHVLVKNVQVGLILGMGVFGPLIGLIRGRSRAAALAGSLKGGKIGVGVLAPLAPVMTEAAIRNQEAERIYDRAFRIRHNSGQMRADRWAVAGGLGGGIAGAFGMVSPLVGPMVGIAMGTVSAGVYTNKILK